MASKKKHLSGVNKRGARGEPMTPLIQPAQPRTFPVVGIGASAGGLEAFRQLLEHLPADTGMAFVLVQHIDPRRESLLAKLLSTVTDMPAREAANDLSVEPNHVYVIPRNTNMAIASGVLRLSPLEQTRGRRRPIDYFMRSLAEEKGVGGVGVILSGTGSDGARGLEAIKAEGGITFAQDEKTAKHYGMPRSAINAGCVDFELPPNRIAEELARLAQHHHVLTVEADGRGEVAPSYQEYGAGADNLDDISRLAQEVSGLDFSHYHPDAIRQSVTRRMTLLKLDGLNAYADYLCDHNEESEKLLQDMLSGVAGFFRDPESIEALKEKVFPELVKMRDGDEPLRVWIVGCLTGEEVYSIAVAFLEFTETQVEQIPIQIFATDPNNSSISLARAGLFSQSIVNNVSPERLRRFFVKSRGGFQISKQVRGLCYFARHNLLTDPPFPRIDLVSCRDLLIRLSPVMRKKAIHTLHYALKPSGFLLLGSSETVGVGANLFKLEDEKRNIYSRIAGPSYMQFRYLPGAEPMEAIDVSWRGIQALDDADDDSVARGDGGQAESAKAGRGRGANRGTTPAKLSESQLRRKLRDSREYLRSLIDQHEAYAEELQSANEELQSSNEELQSVSEELEIAKQQLQFRNEQLEENKRLIDFSIEPIYIWDFDQGIADWNYGCERLYGYTRAEAVGRNDRELLRI